MGLPEIQNVRGGKQRQANMAYGFSINKRNMKNINRWTSLIAASALLVAASAANAGGKTVSYTCQQGKKIKVTYDFNRQGIPTRASAYLNGKKRVMPINLNRSDDVDTVFGDEKTYSLSTSYMDRKNHAAQSIMVTDPRQQIIYKDCNPKSGRKTENDRHAETVLYRCEQGKKLAVTYGFNEQGLPTFARAKLAGHKILMPINLNRSDNVDTIFGNDGEYRLASSYMDKGNFKRQPVIVTNPSDQIVFKNCSPR